MNLKTVMTSRNATLDQPAPRQDKTSYGGLPVRTNLRAGTMGDTNGGTIIPKVPSSDAGTYPLDL